MRMIWVGAALLLSGCAGDGGSDETDAELNLTREATSDGGTWTVTYTASQDPIPQSENFTITVAVQGEGASELDLTWDARMPLHGHGMNTQAETTAVGDGTFNVTGMLFHMPGHWEMSAELTDGTQTETAIFDVQCCE
ncbi:MAG: hypothetical protein AB8H79_06265 [Myxococcota bacterium]